MIAHRTPHPPDKGDRIRTYQLLRFLAGKASVDLAALVDEPVSCETQRVLASLADRVEFVPVAPRTRWIRAALSVCRGRSATEGLFASRAMHRIVDRWCAEVPYDLIVVVCSSMAQYLPKQRVGLATTLIDLIDVDSQKWFDYAANSSGLKRSLYRLEGRRVRALEAALPRHFDHVALTTTDEVECYRGFCPDASVTAMPNGVDFEAFHPNDAAIQAPNSCVFVGALDYKPNVEGVKWFCDAVWPQVIAARPDASFSIVGRRPTKGIQRLAERPGVQVIGDVADVRPYLWKATLVVAPLQVARGVQNKVLEALAAGKPVIATPQAITGLGVTVGEHLYQAEGPAEWAAAITRVMASDGERRRLGAAGREFVCERHDWSTCLQRLDDFLGIPRKLPSPAA